MRGCLAFLACASCTPDRIRVSAPTLPEESLAAILFESEAGAVITSTGLVRPPLEMELNGISADEAFRISLLAYTSTLANDVDPETLVDSRVHVASIEEPMLPRPVWTGTGVVEGSEVTLRPSLDERDLTAGWLAPCPARIVSSAVSTCSRGLCQPAATVRGCRLEIDASTCEAGVVLVHLDPKTPRVRERGGFEACSLAVREPAFAALDCLQGGSECGIDVFGELEVPSVEVDRISIFPELSFVDGAPALPGLAARDGKLFVLTFDGRQVPPTTCTDRFPGRWFELGGEPLSITRTGTTSPCPSGLLVDPGGDGFFGLFDSPPAIERLDADFRVLDRLVVEEATNPSFTFHSYMTTSDGRLFVSLRARTEQASLMVADVVQRPLSLVSIHSFENVEQLARIAWAFGKLALVDNVNDFFELHEAPLGGAWRRVAEVSLTTATSLSVRSIHFDVLSNRLILTGFRQTGTFYAIEEDGTASAFVIDRVGARPGQAVTWPFDPTKLAVPVFFSNYSQSAIRLFEPRHERVLPIELVPEPILGRGSTDMLSDVEARVVWEVFAYTGDVLRVRAR
ncbi:MAG: hypothetical protein HYV07_21260 [Deltaproteobacteria bacterium]|nr:hypothetical protein [Deltaproteobacteria bacterium]